MPQIMADTSTNPDPDFAAQVVSRQTDYDLPTARRKLSEHKGDVVAVIREYHGKLKEPGGADENAKSTNQRIYKEIRGLMDGAASEHRRISAEEQEKQRKLDAFTKNARMLAALTTPPTCLLPVGRKPGPLVAGITSSPSAIPTAFLVLDDPPPDESTRPWLLRCNAADQAPAVAARDAGASGLLLDGEDELPLPSTVAAIRESWASACICIRIKPNGPASLSSPVGDRELTALENGRVMRARDDGRPLVVVTDSKFKEYLASVKELEEAGVDFSITDPFYDIGTYLRLVVATRQAGIKMSVCPCLKPIKNGSEFEEDARRLNVRVPPGVEAAAHKLVSSGDDKGLAEYGEQLAKTAFKALTLRGVQVCLLETRDEASIGKVAAPLMHAQNAPAPAEQSA